MAFATVTPRRRQPHPLAETPHKQVDIGGLRTMFLFISAAGIRAGIDKRLGRTQSSAISLSFAYKEDRALSAASGRPCLLLRTGFLA